MLSSLGKSFQAFIRFKKFDYADSPELQSLAMPRQLFIYVAYDVAFSTVSLSV